MDVWKNENLKMLGVWSLILAYIATSMTLRHNLDSVFQSVLVLLVPIGVIVHYLFIRKKDQSSDLYIRGLKVTIYLSYCWSLWMLQQIYAVADYENWIYLLYFLPAFLLYLLHKKSEWYLLSGVSLLYLVFQVIHQIPLSNTSVTQYIVIALLSLAWYFLHKEKFGRFLFFTVSLCSTFFAYTTYTATKYLAYETIEIDFPNKVASIVVVTVFYFLLFYISKEKKLYKRTTTTLLTVWTLYAFIDITNLFSILSTNISYILMATVIVLTILIELFSSLRKKQGISVSSKMEDWGIHVPYLILSVLISFLFLVSFTFLLSHTLHVEFFISLILFISSIIGVVTHRYIKSLFLQNLSLTLGILSGFAAILKSNHSIYVGIIFGIVILTLLLTAKKQIEKLSSFFLLEFIVVVECIRIFESENIFLFLSLIHLGCYVLVFFKKKENFLLRNLVFYGWIYISFHLFIMYPGKEFGFIFFVHTIYILTLLAFIIFNKDVFIKRFSMFIYLVTNVLLYQTTLIGPFVLSFVLVCAGGILLYMSAKEKSEEEPTETNRTSLRYEWIIGGFLVLILLGTIGYQEWNYAQGTTVKLKVEGIYIQNSKTTSLYRNTSFTYSIQEELNTANFEPYSTAKKRVPLFISLKKNENGIYEAEEVREYTHPNNKKIWMKGLKTYNHIKIVSNNENKIPISIIQESSLAKENKFANVRIAQDGNSRILSIE